MLRLRHEAGDSADRFQVYTGQVLIGTIYKSSGNQWFWGLHGVQNGPGPFNGFVRTLDDAKAKLAAAWGAWLKAEHAHSAAQRLGFRAGLIYTGPATMIESATDIADMLGVFAVAALRGLDRASRRR